LRAFTESKKPSQGTGLFVWDFGADERNRTSDLLITNQLLYQLSYISVAPHFNKKFKPLSTTIGWAACKTPLCASQVLSSVPRDNA
ncbi:MAG: hypothetical protein RL618_2223, partial [Pseudomonadota bacterium]